ncbi:MAG: hypothetical protein K2N73_05515 [Lachnospiraceae bacterium]|nr:hypothetical protein [Lachnospiraceae bacterium]
MQPYQEEYISNLKDIAVLTAHKKPEGRSYEVYREELHKCRKLTTEKIERNMELLRDKLFPLLDNIFAASETQLEDLEKFSRALLDGKNELDSGLFCQIHRALLARARCTKNRNAIIRHLYWLGIGLHSTCNKMVGLELSDSQKYMSQMRLCFAEAAAYLKYYDEIEDTETRGFILRSRANMALGQFQSASAKIRLTRQTLQILQDEGYREKAPELPWDRFVYMTHQQMTSSISYCRDNDMTALDVTAIMESAHIVHQRRIQEAVSRNEKSPVKSAFSCYAIEYYCGLSTIEQLLGKMEVLMDSADTSSFTPDSMYAVISLPAIYCQYLREYPEQLPGREDYLAERYHKIIAYVETFPKKDTNEQIFYFLRQLSTTFIETKRSISYGKFQQKLLLYFAPHIYIHSQVTGKVASVFCDIIMDEDPTFFDDIEHIRLISDPVKKKQEVLQYAMNCGAFHDIGKINFINLYLRTSRQWFEEEYEIVHLHTVVGASRLNACPSTQHYAAIALGHHSWYDGSHGYPESYKRLECPYRQMVDVIGLIDWIDNMLHSSWLYGHTRKSFDEVIEAAIALEGKRFSPLLTAWLRDREVTEKIRQAGISAHLEAYHQLYNTYSEKNR